MLVELGNEQQGGFSPSGLGYDDKVDEWPHEGMSLLLFLFLILKFSWKCVFVLVMNSLSLG